jgi:DNA-binding XRE family transcriptional regulator
MKRRTPARRPVPERELHICRRLRQLREASRLTQTEFAAEIGIKRQRLASYEDGRVALRFDLALRVCHTFFISEKWLALGKGSLSAVMDLSAEPGALQVPADMPFGEAYDLHLHTVYDALFKESGGRTRHLAIQCSPVRVRGLLFALLDQWHRALDREEARRFYLLLVELLIDLDEFQGRTGKLPELAVLGDPRGDYRFEIRLGSWPELAEPKSPEGAVYYSEEKGQPAKQ